MYAIGFLSIVRSAAAFLSGLESHYSEISPLIKSSRKSSLWRPHLRKLHNFVSKMAKNSLLNPLFLDGATPIAPELHPLKKNEFEDAQKTGYLRKNNAKRLCFLVVCRRQSYIIVNCLLEYFWLTAS